MLNSLQDKKGLMHGLIYKSFSIIYFLQIYRLLKPFVINLHTQAISRNTRASNQ